MHSTHRRSNIATHIGALLLWALCPAAVGGEAELAAVQDVLPRLSLPASAAGLSLEDRVDRIEAILPLLATKEDLRNVRDEMKADLRNTEKSLRAEMKADLQATETRLEKVIDQSQKATEAKLEVATANLRAEFSKEMREQLLAFLGVNGGLAAALGTILLLVMRSMLKLTSEVRQQNGRRKDGK